MAKLFGLFLLTMFLISSRSLFAEENTKHCSQKKEDKYKKYLKNTVWIVPPNTLLAYEYDSGVKIPISDQTVWVINDYKQGYFFGSSYTALDKVPSSQRKILGTVTPNGDVYITFYPLTDDTKALILLMELEHLKNIKEHIALLCK